MRYKNHTNRPTTEPGSRPSPKQRKSANPVRASSLRCELSGRGFFVSCSGPSGRSGSHRETGVDFWKLLRMFRGSVFRSSLLRPLGTSLALQSQHQLTPQAARSFVSVSRPSFSLLTTTARSAVTQEAKTTLARHTQKRTSAAMAEAAEGGHHLDLGSYNNAIKWIHWTMAAGIGICFVSVQAAYLSEGSTKEVIMNIHNSVGILMGGTVLARLLVRGFTTAPPHVPGNMLETYGAIAGHWALYAFMLFMPLTGIGMYYLGGADVPFFNLKFPGLANPDKERMTWAKECFKKHKLVGEAFQYLVGIHMGAAGYHLLKGHNVMRRVNPLVAAV
ncbi:unnamed protein product [Vitrella brassicaformis CCMP3155]|uniref:Cytochrome b561 bacterial/Ni-hydrogenase domain-containing protein n=2 Tax=Vitrella brassicaformis TaxID=1169539 RepID=A0A0G4EJG1_VITBC|nr:unnamed protein product [Vitrella brassicaformis CCMP3155]|eukprot:CEL96885.1 unnamed protein product [Vitrella brassicaformis CCMP3155]